MTPEQNLPMPSLGTLIHVTVAPGATLRNDETGAHFELGRVTPQTVTVTTLRRLADGDLLAAEAPAETPPENTL